MTIDTNNMTKDQLKALVAQLAQANQAQASGLMVKPNKSGGVYIRHNSFVEYSEAKGKNYVAGINMGNETAKALFNNPELLDQIKSMINSLA